MARPKNFNRNDVLDKAILLFWKKGFADTSLSDLEQATGVNKSGLYSEFKDKDDIYLESLKRFREQSPIYGLLDQKPLGWDNLERFMTSNLTCKGMKGCLLANTVREYSIVPLKVKHFVEQNSQLLFDQVLKNLQAEKVTDAEMKAKLIITFVSGISLKLNAMKAEHLLSEVQAFIKMCRT